MLRVLNKYSHGYTFAPVVCALRERGFFHLLQEGKAYALEDIAEGIGARPGVLKCCLDLFLVMGWLERVQGGYRMTGDMSNETHVPGWMPSLYEHAFVDVVSSRGGGSAFEKGLERLIEGWGCSSPLDQMLDGVVMIPLMLGLVQGGLVEDVTAGHTARLPLAGRIQEAFAAKKWARKEDEAFQLTGVGKFMLGRCMVTGVTASYRPMLANLPQRLFLSDAGDAGWIDCETVDRTLNVQSSGFQHERYFRDLEETAVSFFSDSPFEDQPDCIADMGCGDGTLLKSLYEVIQAKTERGKRLHERPVLMIGLDMEPEALQESAAKLQGIPHILLHGDVGDPEAIPGDLAKAGVKQTGNVLHVRSFLDHNRRYRGSEDAEAELRWARLPSEVSAIGPGGTRLAPSEALQDLSEHLRRWSHVLDRFGLLVLEVHAQPVSIKRAFFDTAEGFHFDFLHAVSGQYLCEPEYFLAAMAQNGLFSKKACQSYPKGFPYTRITLGYFEKMPYRIDFAQRRSISFIYRMSTKNELELEEINNIVENASELSFVIFDKAGNPCSAVAGSYGGVREDGTHHRVTLEAVMQRSDGPDHLEPLLRFFIQYLQHKNGVMELRFGSHPLPDGIEQDPSIPWRKESHPEDPAPIVDLEL